MSAAFSFPNYNPFSNSPKTRKTQQVSQKRNQKISIWLAKYKSYLYGWKEFEENQIQALLGTY